MFQQKRPRVAAARKHFSGPAKFAPVDYPYRLNFYTTPPTSEITLDQFEQWAIDRLKGTLPSLSWDRL